MPHSYFKNKIYKKNFYFYMNLFKFYDIIVLSEFNDNGELIGEIWEDVLMGNNRRIKNAVANALKGDAVTIAYLGGSVTAGYISDVGIVKESYAEMSFEFFCNKSKNHDCRYINLGLQGADAFAGLALTERHLRAEHPDIVFIEYALNNQMDNESMLAFEGLVRKIYGFENFPAIVLLFIPNKEFVTSESYMRKIGENYCLEIISVSEKLKNEIDTGNIKWSDYSSDNGHPNKWGQKFISDCINEFFNRIWKEKYDGEIKDEIKPYFGDYYTSFQNVYFESIRDIYMTGFKYADSSARFPNALISTNQKQSIISFTIKLRALFIIFEKSNDINCGEIQIYIDNNYTENVSGYSIYGRNNPTMKLVFKENISAFHDVKIIMRNDNHNRFITIIGIGIC